MKKLIASLLFTLTVGFAAPGADALAASHTVKQGDTLYNIGQRYAVPITSLKTLNKKTTNTIYIGEILEIPAPISHADRKLMAQLVEAEAKGEIYAGKVAVATVILNRVDSPLFPNTIRGVVYEKTSTGYAFTPVKTGSINNTPSAASYKAVNEAIAYRGFGKGSLYFYNPAIIKNTWILSRTVTVRIGNHTFAK